MKEVSVLVCHFVKHRSSISCFRLLKPSRSRWDLHVRRFVQTNVVTRKRFILQDVETQLTRRQAFRIGKRERIIERLSSARQ